jgi:hypothetical protein
MNEFEAAFFYGDYSMVREMITKLLYENVEAIPVPEEIYT